MACVTVQERPSDGGVLVPGMHENCGLGLLTSTERASWGMATDQHKMK